MPLNVLKLIDSERVKYLGVTMSSSKCYGHVKIELKQEGHLMLSDVQDLLMLMQTVQLF